MTATLYINNVWFRTINVDKWHDRIQYLIPTDCKPRYTKECNLPLYDDIQNHMLYFIHAGYGFYHCQVPQETFELAFKDRYETTKRPIRSDGNIKDNQSPLVE